MIFLKQNKHFIIAAIVLLICIVAHVIPKPMNVDSYQNFYYIADQRVTIYDHRMLEGISISFYGTYVFKDKEVLIDEALWNNNEFVRDFAGHLSNSAIQPLNMELADIDAKLPSMHIYGDDGVQCDFYIYFGDEWLSDDTIYLMGHDNGDIYALPSSYSAITSRQIPKVNEAAELRNSFTFIEPMDSDLIAWINRSVIPLIISKQFFLLCLALLMGLLLQGPFTDRSGGAYTAFLAYPIGVTYWIFCVYAMGLLRLPLNIGSCYVLPSVMALLWSVFGRKILRRDIDSGMGEAGDNRHLIISLVIVISLFGIISAIPQYWINVGDAARNIVIAEKARVAGGITAALYEFTSFSIYGPTVHLLARMIQLPFSYTHIWALVACGLISAALALIRLAEHEGVKRWAAICFCVLSVLALISSKGVRLHFRWLMNNLPLGICLGIFVAFLLLYTKTKNIGHYYLTLPLFFMFAFARIEGPVYALLFLVLARDLFPGKRKHYLCTAIFTMASFAQFILYYVHMGSGGETFWNPLRGMMVPLVSLAYLGFLRLSDQKPLRFISLHMNVICTIGLGLVNLVFLLLDPSGVRHNVWVMRYHLFVGGVHGFVWYIFLLAVLLVDRVKDTELKKNIYNLILFVGNYVLVVFALMSQFDWNPRADYGDSSGRMLFHVEFVIPVIVFMILLGIMPRQFRKNPDRSDKGMVNCD